jgi:hypothetical protein
MIKSLFVLAAAAVALTAVPAEARYHHYNRGYNVGYRFGPSYAYTDYGALPRPYVRRYHLRPNYRYVRNGDRIYVVDPATYAVTRILSGVR